MASDTEIREAKPSDKDAVIEFSTDTWDGWDYIPEIFDDWLQGPGTLLAAERDDECIAIIHFIVEDKECWLEGLRVHPEHRRQGTATELLTEATRRAKSEEAEIARGMVFSWNTEAQNLLEKEGFNEAAQLRYARGFSFPYGSKLTPADFNESLDAIWETKEYDEYAGLYATNHWSMKEIPGDIETLGAEILGYSADDGVRSAMIYSGSRVNKQGVNDRRELVIGFIWCEPRYVGDIALDIRAEAREREMHDALVFIPDREEYTASFDQAGYDVSDPVVIYEKELSQT